MPSLGQGSLHLVVNGDFKSQHNEPFYGGRLNHSSIYIKFWLDKTELFSFIAAKKILGWVYTQQNGVHHDKRTIYQ
jgi:hypothetical protein